MEGENFKFSKFGETGEQKGFSGPSSVPLGKILLEKGLITQDQLLSAINTQKETGEYLGQILLDQGLISESDLINNLSDQLDSFFGGMAEDFEDGSHADAQIEVSPEAVQLIPAELALRSTAIPLSVDPQKKVLRIGLLDTRDMQSLDEIRFKTGMNLEPIKVSQEFLEEAWSVHYHWTGQRAMNKQNDLLQSEFRAFAQKLNDAQMSPFINRVLVRAVELGASDIHIDPFEKEVSIRYRLDGKLYQVANFSKKLYPIFVGRMRVMAKVDVAERKTAIDSRLSIQVSESKVAEFRLSILSAQHGDRIVLRVQRSSTEIPRLNSINLPKVYLSEVKEKLQHPHGLIIVTGPTGSGKSTTLYAMLTELADLSRNVMTIEDPIELSLDGVSQIPVDAERGQTFSAILRATLRQDPDVIMLGEIRDEETAHIAVRAAMTGHLVLCSLHTNDALSAITRLSDMGIPPYYIAPALNLLIAQRLIRLLCEHCKKPKRQSKQLMLELGFTPAQLKGTKFYEAVGCSKCNMTGYKGRIPIFEMLSVKQSIRDAISRGDDMRKIKNMAKKNRYVPFGNLLREYVKRGKTSIEEALPFLLDL